MKSINYAITGLASSLLLNLGFTGLAEKLDPTIRQSGGVDWQRHAKTSAFSDYPCQFKTSAFSDYPCQFKTSAFSDYPCQFKTSAFSDYPCQFSSQSAN